MVEEFETVEGLKEEIVNLEDVSPLEALFELVMTSEGRPLKSRRFITLLTYLVVVFVFGAGKAMWPDFMAGYEVESFAQLVGGIVSTMLVGYSLQDYAHKKYQAQ